MKRFSSRICKYKLRVKSYNFFLKYCIVMQLNNAFDFFNICVITSLRLL